MEHYLKKKNEKDFYLLLWKKSPISIKFKKKRSTEK